MLQEAVKTLHQSRLLLNSAEKASIPGELLIKVESRWSECCRDEHEQTPIQDKDLHAHETRKRFFDYMNKQLLLPPADFVKPKH